MAGEEKKEIVEKVKQIISEQLGVDELKSLPALHSWTISAPTRWIRSNW